MRRATLAAPALALVALLAACGSIDGDGGDDDALPPFCEAYGELLVGPLADDTTDTADPAVLQDAVGTTVGVLNDLIAAAPSGLSDDANALADDYNEAFAVLVRYDYDLARVQAEATDEEKTLLNDFGDTDPAPFQTIQQWVADHCAGEVTLPPDLLSTTTTATTATTPTTSP